MFLDAHKACTSTQAAWEHELNTSLSSSQWASIWRSGIHLSKCVRYKIIQYKILCRAYVTPVRLAKISVNTPDLCWHNCGSRGSLIHLLWDCPAVKSLWLEVHALLTELLDVDLPLSPIVCILGNKPDNVTCPMSIHLWALACLSVKRLILLNWKERKPACFLRETWLGDYLDLLNMERAACLLKDFDKGLSGHWDIVRRLLS